MVIGEYPCCDETLCIALPDRPLPCWFKDQCPGCGTTCWHKLSRLDPQSWTEEGFDEEFELLGGCIKPRIK